MLVKIYKHLKLETLHLHCVFAPSRNYSFKVEYILITGNKVN